MTTAQRQHGSAIAIGFDAQPARLGLGLPMRMAAQRTAPAQCRANRCDAAVCWHHAAAANRHARVAGFAPHRPSKPEPCSPPAWSSPRWSFVGCPPSQSASPAAARHGRHCKPVVRWSGLPAYLPAASSLACAIQRRPPQRHAPVPHTKRRSAERALLDL